MLHPNLQDPAAGEVDEARFGALRLVNVLGGHDVHEGSIGAPDRREVDGEVRGVEDLLSVGLLALRSPQDHVAAGDVGRVGAECLIRARSLWRGCRCPWRCGHEDLGAAGSDEAKVGLARLRRFALSLIGDLLWVEEAAGHGVPVERLRVLPGILRSLAQRLELLESRSGAEPAPLRRSPGRGRACGSA